MKIEKKLFSSEEVGQIIQIAVAEIVQKFGANEAGGQNNKSTEIRQWAEDLLPQVESAIAEEIVKRHVQGVTLSVWVGPPGSGKGTNIETVELLGRLYAEVVSQGGARLLEEPYHSLLLQFSVDQSAINTGTKGMFNRPEGEYLPLFGDLVPVIGKHVADGGFVPDEVVSVLVELMILYRLTQRANRIQIDLWPRTGNQFLMFSSLGKKIRQEQGKLTNEVVVIKVLPQESLTLVRDNPPLFAAESKSIAGDIETEVTSAWYTTAFTEGSSVRDPRERFELESAGLGQLFTILTQKHASEAGKITLEEMRTVCDRMAFRFDLIAKEGKSPRPDEYPLSVIRRLAIYTGETSPAFLNAVADSNGEQGYFVVSSAGTPEEVIAGILDTLAGKATDDSRWKQIKNLAGVIATAIVYRKELIVSDLTKRLGGIVNS